MSSALDSITAATKLRRAEIDVQRELEAKREEYNRRMAQVKEGEAQLAADRAELQDTLVQYYKFIQENEIKRSRAMKKVAIEEKQRKEREAYIAQLTQRLQGLEQKRDEMKTQYEDIEKYQTFLEEVLSRNDGDEYQEPRDIMKRWMTLCDNTSVLQARKTQLEEDLLRTRSSLNLARQRRGTENIALQNQLNEMQMSFESLQKAIKAKQDKLDRMIKQKSSTTRTVSHVSMATANLYDRCVSWVRDYSGRGKVETLHSNVLHQLHVICDCLEDFQNIIMQHQEQQRQVAAQQVAAAAAQQAAVAKAG
ncbi:Domain of unknown function (DUF4200) [Leishmania donovani]|uniref:Domain_of_uncharacterized_function_(DUF4200)_-_pu tative n=3 Tax=Leishmania donovani species complex TaxID=38574 RepID=A0A6L0WW71_LEIIN|nr:conserved hypothetical protein [Leishmania infantum JPCM5]AYU77098.1 protein of unknown function (DUF4200), putative [Leishmania donovani]CAC9464869.1 Domain_of_uncharacterised_function_(DUF4200)_-_putative [Leishmania infantum]CAJ1987120.1 Domain of unknown function (DUF4200) [Leishmania donovani]CAM66425.1 conserved hypothetical protein [Leishmania infantum JPCM5]SUZ40073.1 Domain_of_uncharacterised_function_(DUF4200)_-_putative [Leishmania infantum]|eukprot:XP_001464050.1 conserved hypothetical protein [Leishmania infantum JPCM5]